MLAKVDSRAMREMNRALLLDMIRREATVTRTELARRSALTKPTVSAIVDALIAEGLVREVGFGLSASRKGRRTRLLELNDAASAFIGIHFGVHHTALAVADARGRLRTTKTVASFRNRPERVMGALRPLVKLALREAKLPRSRLAGIGVAVAGLVDQATGSCVLAPNLRWYDVPLRAALAEEFRTPVAVRNVMHAGAIAEGRLGAAQGVRSFAWVYVGTGIGAAIVVDGRVYYGKHGYSGELGHCTVMDNGPRCGCGRTGCLETVASGTAIEAAARASLGGKPPRTTGPRELDAHAVAIAARGGDPEARRILARAGEYLGMGISYLLNLLDPEMVVLGGRVSHAGECLLDPVRRSIARHAMRAEGIPIVPTAVEGDVMLRGAVLLAMAGDQVGDP
ncbi:MAG TPA: ROK family transcriptional regulator [Polyangiaceae bacterium]|nr:ROK family transcriptional regulator [Polyangiaceae bacterium]